MKKFFAFIKNALRRLSPHSDLGSPLPQPDPDQLPMLPPQPAPRNSKPRLRWSMEAQKQTSDIIKLLAHIATEKGTAATECVCPDGVTAKQFGDHIRWMVSREPRLRRHVFRYRRVRKGVIHVSVRPRHEVRRG